MEIADLERLKITIAAMERMVADCEARNHEHCTQTGNCRTVLDHEQRVRESILATSRYDVRQVVDPFVGRLPGHGWPTAALMRVMRDAVTSPPWQAEARRTIVITMALARLGERGFPPDALVRSCLGHELRRGLLLRVAALWHEERCGRLPPTSVPPQAREWFAVLDAETLLTRGRDMQFSDVAVAVLTGDPGCVVESWFKTAALAHVIGWRRSGSLHVDLALDDLVLPQGRDATIWAYERFSTTALDDWSRASLGWELLWIHDPTGTAELVGLSPEVLEERPSSESAVLAALGRRLSGGEHNDPLIDGLKIAQVVESVRSSLGRGDYAAALTLSRRACEGAPRAFHVRMALGFCLIQVDPKEAQRVLEQTVARDAPERAIVMANLVSVLVVQRKFEGLAGKLQALRECCGDVEAWLWDPGSLVGVNDWHVESFRLIEWADAVSAALFNVVE